MFLQAEQMHKNDICFTQNGGSCHFPKNQHKKCGPQSGAATPAEQLQIQVVEQQNLGKLKTSNSLVQQQTFQKPKSL